MFQHLTASWDHLPTPKRPPPSRFQLAVRKTMESLRPTFTYNDERDKLDRQLARRRKRDIEKEERRLSSYEKMEKAREARQARRGRKDNTSPLKRLLPKKERVKSMFVFGALLAPSEPPKKPTSSSTRKRSATTPPTIKPRAAPHRSNSSPVVHPTSRTHRPAGPKRSATVNGPTPRVVYVTSQPASRKTTPGQSRSNSQRQQVKVYNVYQRPTVARTQTAPTTRRR